ncbi:hypothetical protein BN1013_02017 [Candidatus Rubidus massiliensis]|nr:hypothetical protein BN1013_02017 [Candidatus Rubidus massiliensis]
MTFGIANIRTTFTAFSIFKNQKRQNSHLAKAILNTFSPQKRPPYSILVVDPCTRHRFPSLLNQTFKQVRKLYPDARIFQLSNKTSYFYLCRQSKLINPFIIYSIEDRTTFVKKNTMVNLRNKSEAENACLVTLHKSLVVRNDELIAALNKSNTDEKTYHLCLRAYNEQALKQEIGSKYYSFDEVIFLDSLNQSQLLHLINNELEAFKNLKQSKNISITFSHDFADKIISLFPILKAIDEHIEAIIGLIEEKIESIHKKEDVQNSIVEFYFEGSCISYQIYSKS